MTERLSTTARAVLVAAGRAGLPGGARLLQSLTYLLDRRLGRRTPFESHFHGPVSAEVADALGRWISIGLARMTITRDGRRGDPLEGDRVNLMALVGPRGFEMGVPAVEADVARELLELARQAGALSGTTAPTVAAKLAWIRELDPSSASTPLETLAASLRWAYVDQAELASGVALARALGY